MDILTVYFQVICIITSNVMSVDFHRNDFFLQAMTDFALNLYREVGSGNNENVFISPIGDQILLTLILQGAKGETETELKSALFYQTLPNDEINLQFRALNNRLNAVHDSYILQLANRFYFQKGFQYQNEFSKLLTTYYRDSIQEVEFLTNLKTAEEEINQWVKMKTDGKITEIVKDLSINTVLILTSFLYFKGKWETPFNETNTKIGDFTSSQGQKQSLEMMTQSKSFMYGEDHNILNCKIVELPYFSKELSMFIILPFDVNGLKQLELKLNYIAITSLIKSMTEVELNPLQIPKFKMNKEYHLKSALQNLGIKKLFEHPDLSGMLGNTSIAVFLSEVIQKTFLEVNEKGSEAAASTEVQIGFRMISLLSGTKKDFIANQPFIFFIRENISGLILFLGRVTSDIK